MKKHLWLLIFLQGLIAVGLGLVAVLWPLKSLVALTWFIGAFLLLESVLTIIIAFWPGDKNGTTGTLLLEGIIGLVFAFLVMSWPQTTLLLLFLAVALWAIATGILGVFKVVFSKHTHELNHPTLFVSIGKIILGIVLLSYPQASVGLVVVATGFFFLIIGLGDVIYSLKYKTVLG